VNRKDAQKCVRVKVVTKKACKLFLQYCAQKKHDSLKIEVKKRAIDSVTDHGVNFSGEFLP